ncbi:MAG: hypothetical protein ACLR8Y_02335 [Alistipes indistinctus]
MSPVGKLVLEHHATRCNTARSVAAEQRPETGIVRNASGDYRRSRSPRDGSSRRLRQNISFRSA